MAAELVGGAFLSAALQVAFERLASSDIKHYFRRNKRIDALLNRLHITLLSVNQVLEDAEERQYTKPNVKKWLDELKHVVFMADDLLDEIAYEATRQKLEAQSHTATAKVRGFFTAFVNTFGTEFEGRIQQVLDDLEFLAKQKGELGLKEGCGGRSEIGVGGKISNRLPSTSLVGESKIYGRDGDKEEIIKFLLSENVIGKQLSVISIVGMGGLGKTTLAQHVYNDPRMEKQFQLKAWVCVAEEFDGERITKTILSALGCKVTGNEDLNQLQLKLKEILTEKKFLIVLDDVWNLDPTTWEALQVTFICGALGSKIVATTRNKDVAWVMRSIQVQYLQVLEREDGWRLFVKHVFNDNDASTYTNLEPIGRKIVEKCKGLPLAIKSLGGLVGRELSQQHWSKILESDVWLLPDDKSNIIPALRLSYHYLPSNLKRCFAFCSIFPKDYIIYKDILIQLWMAEGLLHCHQGNKSAEELGEEFFSDLESRSFFQQVEGWDKHCFIMHDLVNDLAKSMSGEFCVQIEGGKARDIPTKARYFSCSFINGDNDNILEPIYECKLLRSFVAITGMQSMKVEPSLLSRFKHLRILSWMRCENIIKLAHDISNLRHLRYLDISWCSIIRIPDSICALHNLQTLKLNHCCSLVELPTDMYKLINLRYLNLSLTGITKLPNSICKLHHLHTLILIECRSLAELPTDFHKLINLHHLNLVGTKIREMPQHMGSLKHLQYLPKLFVGKQSGSNIKELERVSNIGETLSISQLENIEDAMDAREANMRDKTCLHELELEWSGNHKDSQNERCVLEALQPHVNLKELTITNYGGTRFVDWFDAPYLPNLVSLGLSECKYCFYLPPLGQLPSLKRLSISGFDGIKEIGTEFYGNKSSSVVFRSLEYLNFNDMREWEEWMHCEGECFPCLQLLRIKSCPKLTNSLPPYLASLKSLWIKDCRQLEPSLPQIATMTNADIPKNGVEEGWVQQILITYPNFEQLHLKNCPKLVSFPTCELSAPKLKSLFIIGWSFQRPLSENMQTQLPTIRSLWFKNCPHLGSLCLENCPMLESFQNGILPSSLVSLSIIQCPKLIHSRKQWGLHKLHSLQYLRISDDFVNVEFFPEEALLPPNLLILTFDGCSNLKTINYKGLLHLTSLQSLAIYNCPSLQCLPEQGLLNSLCRLDIWGHCPLLKQRYQKENGPDWHKISHIPRVWIE